MVLFAGYLFILFMSSYVFADSSNCEDSTVTSCATRYGYGLSFGDVISLMINNPKVIPFYCARNRMQNCLGSCADTFRMSKYGHTYSMCVFKDDIVRYERCWTGSFKREAERCYWHHFPSYRANNLYPIPIRMFSMSTIEEDCFSEEQDDDCKYYKTLLLWNMMPTYYQVHSYPDEYRHRYI